MGSKPGNRPAGIAIFICCIAGFIIYTWLLIFSDWNAAVLRFTVLAAVAAALGVLAWIGFSMATAPAPPAGQGQFRAKELDKEPRR